MRGFPSTLAVISTVALAACSDGVGPGPLSVKERTSLCQDFCRYRERCMGSQYDQCVTDCVPALEWIRGDLFHQVVACVNDATCEEASMCDQFGGPNGEALPLPIHEKFWSTCSDAFAACGLDPAGYCDDPDITAVNTQLVGQLIDCLDMACADIVSCLDDTAATQHYGF